MIDWFRAWSKGIVVAVIISTIIEMILPDNTSKKYIKIIIGIFIVYTIISPVINQFTGEDISEYIKVNEVIETSSNVVESNEISKNTTSSIKKIYTQNLENDLKTKLKAKGYVAGSVYINISNDESYNIEKIDIKIDEKISVAKEQKQAKTIVDNIKSVKIKIENNNSQNNEIINENDKNEIKEYIKTTYEVDINKINIY
ncbi:MAG: stage III sporulation protein AF [Clostridia bacterium]|nr:stage III sporulation protein AF [Clostridia bacterium]